MGLDRFTAFCSKQFLFILVGLVFAFSVSHGEDTVCPEVNTTDAAHVSLCSKSTTSGIRLYISAQAFSTPYHVTCRCQIIGEDNFRSRIVQIQPKKKDWPQNIGLQINGDSWDTIKSFMTGSNITYEMFPENKSQQMCLILFTASKDKLVATCGIVQTTDQITVPPAPSSEPSSITKPSTLGPSSSTPTSNVVLDTSTDLREAGAMTDEGRNLQTTSHKDDVHHPSESGLSIGLVAGCSAAGFFVVAMVIILICCWKRLSAKRATTQDTNARYFKRMDNNDGNVYTGMTENILYVSADEPDPTAQNGGEADTKMYMTENPKYESADDPNCSDVTKRLSNMYEEVN